MALLFRIYWTTETLEYICLFCEYYERANPDFARQKIKIKEHGNKTLSLQSNIFNGSHCINKAIKQTTYKKVTGYLKKNEGH